MKLNEPIKDKKTNNSIKDKKFEDLSICGLILCAGQGTRTGLNYNKMLYYIGKKTILEMTLDRFISSKVKKIFLAVNQNDYQPIKELSDQYKDITICVGGDSRSESVRQGLNEIGHCDIVVIHDGARPYVTPAMINESINSAIKHGSGIVAVPTVDSIKEIKNNAIVRTLSRSGLFNIQTPQTFRFDEISKAYNICVGQFNDDSEVYEKAGYSPQIVLGGYDNVKVTTMEDLYRPPSIHSRVGVGFDVHQLVKGKKLILGGVRIHHDKGLKGHSDADVLTHAIMDALLSAAGLPDIGVLFPDTDMTYKDINSIILLDKVFSAITIRGYRISNISAVIMAQKPHLSEVIPDISRNLVNVLKLQDGQITISATTTENLGIIGHEKGIAVSATCMLTY